MERDEVEHQKLCECGCGEPTLIATMTNRRADRSGGQPNRFIRGHHLTLLAAARRIDLTNQRFDRLTVIRAGDRSDHWVVKCECGSVLDVTAHMLRSGKTKSCGCAKM
jgi:hypothetical protein